jgi:hypothetical protein
LLRPYLEGKDEKTANLAGRATRRKVSTVSPYDGRHAYASLLIHEGRPLLQVAAALGHSSGDTTLRHYAHVFDEARLASGVGMVDAIRAARADLAGKGLHNRCTTGVVRPLRSVARAEKNPG